MSSFEEGEIIEDSSEFKSSIVDLKREIDTLDADEDLGAKYNDLLEKFNAYEEEDNYESSEGMKSKNYSRNAKSSKYFNSIKGEKREPKDNQNDLSRRDCKDNKARDSLSRWTSKESKLNSSINDRNQERTPDHKLLPKNDRFFNDKKPKEPKKKYVFI